MTTGPPIGSTAMDAPKSNWCLIFVVVIVMVAGFSGVGSTQQMPNVTTNTTTTTGGQDTQMTNGTTTSIETTARSPTPTPDANDGWENAAPIGTDRTANGTLPVGDQDWHVFPVESSGRITVRLVAGNQTNMSGFLYNGAGDLLDSTYIGPGEQLSLTGQTASAGDYTCSFGMRPIRPAHTHSQSPSTNPRQQPARTSHSQP
jgi:hypothetical protein